MSGSPSRSGSASDRPVGDDLGDLGAPLAQFVGEQLARDVGVRQQHRQAADVARVCGTRCTTASARYSAA